MKVKIGLLALFLLILAFFTAVPASANNIVANPDFSGGPYSGGGAGWTTTTNFYGYDQWGFVYLGDHGDPNISDAVTGCQGSDCTNPSGSYPAILSQDLPTVSGDSYTLSFLYSPGAGSPNELKTLFGSTLASDLVDIGTNSFVLYTVSDLVATSSTTDLEFLGREDAGDLALTEVSVADNGPVIPEPSSLYLLGTGLLGLAGLFGRKLLA